FNITDGAPTRAACLHRRRRRYQRHFSAMHFLNWITSRTRLCEYFVSAAGKETFGPASA
ncbi:hypothetical protein Ddye_023616, partial [Dipteronia dyeriana]